MQSTDGRPANAVSTTRSRGRWRAFLVRALAAAFGLVVSIVLAELVVRVVAPQDLSGTWRQTDDCGLFVHQREHSARHQSGERVVRYRFTKDGLRDLGQGDGAIKVLCLGDSYTFGWLLRDQDTFIAKLQAMADREFGRGRFALLDGGHGGWGTSDYVRYFEEYGDDLGVSGVIIFLNTDDIGRSLEHPDYLIAEDDTLTPTPRRGARSDSWLKRVANALAIYPWLLEHSHLLQLSRRVMLGGSGGPCGENAARQPALVPQSSTSMDSASVRRFARALFRRLRHLADERSVRLLVLTTGFHGLSTDREREPTSLFMATAARDLADDGIAFYDCTDETRRRLGDDFSSVRIEGDGHPNEAGAALIADMNWEVVRAFLADVDARRRDGTVAPADSR